MQAAMQAELDKVVRALGEVHAREPHRARNGPSTGGALRPSWVVPNGKRHGVETSRSLDRSCGVTLCLARG
jgi:hypothetical protein